MVDDTQDFIRALQEAPNTDMPFGVDQPKPVGQMANALGNYAAYKAQQAWALPQRSMEASGADLANLGDPQRTELASIQPAMETAQMMMGRMPFAPKGTAGVFGSNLFSKTADRAALDRAYMMEDKGADPSRIWRENNWMRHPVDDRWNYEIPDWKMSLNAFPANEGEMLSAKVGHFVNHPEATQAYPDLNDIQMYVTKDSRYPQGRGLYNPNTHTIEVEAPNMQTAKSVAAHELGHGISHIEGLSWGGDPTDLAEQLIEENPGLDWVKAQRMGTDLYNRLADEVKQRNVQTRLNWGTQARRVQGPWETQDVPYSQQLFRDRATGVIAPNRFIGPSSPSLLDMTAQALRGK